MTSDVLETIRTHATKTPMAAWLNYAVELQSNELIHRLIFDERHIGNPIIRALHGGVTAAFLEFSAQCAIRERVEPATKVETINAAVDYVASAKDKDLKARVEITRLGRRIAFATARCWQDDETTPVATAQICCRLLR